MISLKRYLDSTDRPATEAAEPETRGLLAAAMDAYGCALVEMGNCSVEACPGMGESLKWRLSDLKSGISTGMGCEALAETGSGAQEALRVWGRETARHLQQKACEVKDLLLAMARTAESVSARDQRSAGQMSQVTERLKAIASLEDLTEIRASIEKSATELKTSIDRMTEEGKAVLDELRGQVASYQCKLDEAEKLAARDALTGLGSRLYVEGQIEKRMAMDAPLCVAVIDIDSFKKVNDDHGHLTGDELLRQFGAELRSACRSTDVIGRWGGDEFIVLFDCALEEAEAQTVRLRKWICGNYDVRGRSGELKLRVDASIGLAARMEGEGMQELLARADAAMYGEKGQRTKAGRAA
ncbi:MAG: GGDEF domain-containing protein [Terracidiphilus sp.]